MINTGSELLLGKVLNTNASWLAEKLCSVGALVKRQVTVPDGIESILEAMKSACLTADVVIVTGGLGPTSDDLSRDALAALCEVPLELNSCVLGEIRSYMEKRGHPFTPSNERQAYVPHGAEVIPNPNGTAPGLWMPAGEASFNTVVILLPGPPRELKPMVEHFVLPRLKASILTQPPALLEYKFLGVGESYLQDKIDHPLSQISGLTVGYCARIGEVDVRLMGTTDVVERADTLLHELVGPLMVVPLGLSAEQAVVAHLVKSHRSLATVESCTGGLIAKRITDVAGASDVFCYGWVTYSNEAKVRLVGVNPEALAQYGAVSEQVARQMAEGAVAISGASISVAVTGVAGPSGGTTDTPVGTVWIAFAYRDAMLPTRTLHHCMPRDRDSFREYVSQVVFAELLKM